MRYGDSLVFDEGVVRWNDQYPSVLSHNAAGIQGTAWAHNSIKLLPSGQNKKTDQHAPGKIQLIGTFDYFLYIGMPIAWSAQHVQHSLFFFF